MIFREPDLPGEAWRIRYERSATECQDVHLWDEYEEFVEATLVRAMEKIVAAWE